MRRQPAAAPQGLAPVKAQLWPGAARRVPAQAVQRQEPEQPVRALVQVQVQVQLSPEVVPPAQALEQAALRRGQAQARQAQARQAEPQGFQPQGLLQAQRVQGLALRPVPGSEQRQPAFQPEPVRRVASPARKQRRP